MSRIFTFTNMSFPTGTTNLPQTSIPANTSSITLALARNTAAAPTKWPNATTTIHLALQFSYDGGVTFVPAAPFDSAGGLQRIHNHDVAQSTATWTFKVNPTHVKGILVVAGGPLLTTVTIDMQ
jgi:hypothetical protein